MGMAWTVYPIALLCALIGLLVTRRLLVLFGRDDDGAEAVMLRRAVGARGDAALVAAVAAVVGLVAWG